MYKVLVIGDLGTGKTSIIKRYVHQFFSPHYRATVSPHCMHGNAAGVGVWVNRLPKNRIKRYLYMYVCACWGKTKVFAHLLG